MYHICDIFPWNDIRANTYSVPFLLFYWTKHPFYLTWLITCPKLFLSLTDQCCHMICLQDFTMVFSYSSGRLDIRLVPHNTVNKGTSKCHRTDEKAPMLWCTFLYQYFILRIIPPNPAPIQLRIGLIKKLQCWQRNLNRRFVSFFGLVLTPKKYLFLVRTFEFSIFLGIPLKSTPQHLIYYFLYHELTWLSLNICPQL